MNDLTRNILLRVSDCDLNNRWLPGRLLIELQEAAGEHSDALGCGRKDLLPLGLAWVVTRLQLTVERYPTWGETVSVRTFHGPTRHRFFPRFFEVTDEKGRRIASASSLWLLMDLQTRQSVSADRLPAPLPENRDIPRISLPGNILPLEGKETKMVYPAAYTDMDANGHVNNTRYLDWMCNALGTDLLSEHPLKSAVLHYNSEIRPDQEVQLILRQNGLQAQLTGIVEDRAAFETAAELMESPAEE